MQLTLRDKLPFVTVTLAHGGTAVTVPQVLIDTGSARTIFAADVVSRIHITQHQTTFSTLSEVWAALKWFSHAK